MPNAVKVLAYLHTFNDADVVEGTIEALCAQTYPIPEILLVDNASTDATLDRTFPSKVTIIRNSYNLGTSGAVAIGMEYAIANGYDWIYILDADSTPQPDAIDKLVRCFEGFSPELQASTWRLSSLLKDNGVEPHEGVIFTPRGVELVRPPAKPSYYACDSNMWSGSLYRLDVVRKLGLPNRDLVLDWGDIIYGYEGAVRGYTGFVERSSVVTHHLHPFETLHIRRFGLRSVKMAYSPPMRCYYHWRNSIYFWLYVYRGNRFGPATISQFTMFLKWSIKAVLFLKKPWPILQACFRGLWDGIHARLENRYGSTVPPPLPPSAER